MNPLTREMSNYLSVEDYHQNEEKHVYYVEMMNFMIERIVNSVPNSDERICDMGAGTGLFTARLLRSVQNHVTAVEIDQECIRLLRRNLVDCEKRSTIVLGDCVRFQGNRPFDWVVSSFANHHVRESDMDAYLSNVRRNLAPNGVFIVGDEFLREYDTESARLLAIIDWHRHVLGAAVRLGSDGEKLVRLEITSLISGLNRIGDFKMSCSVFEFHLAKAGFHFDKKCIGPGETSEVGGVYVYYAAVR